MSECISENRPVCTGVTTPKSQWLKWQTFISCCMTCPSWIVGAASVILGLVEQWPYQTLLITVPVRKGSSGGPHTCDQILSAEVTDATYIHNLLARASPVALSSHKRARKCNPSDRELEKYLVNSTEVQ